MKTLLVAGTFTILIGTYKGFKKRGNNSFKEKTNELSLKELEIELERVKIMIEMEELEEEEAREEELKKLNAKKLDEVSKK